VVYKMVQHKKETGGSASKATPCPDKVR
jgi:hypothetical protein